MATLPVRYALASAAFVACLSLAASSTHAEVTGASLHGSISGPGISTVFLTHAPGRPDELFVVEQRGLILRMDRETGAQLGSTVLNIENLVDNDGNEQGLLGLAFDPNFEQNGYFYVNYTHDPGPGPDTTRIDRFQLTDPLTSTSASLRSRTPILEFNQDFSNHNGGWIGFSPNDGYLYIATGDGGSGNDPNNRGQSLTTRLGKMLRIDVSGDDFPSDPDENYAIPQDNPFVNNSAALDEIWAYGLRNPYRSSFDRETGDLWIGDVGQNAREEIDFQDADWAGGANYGWRLREGDIATPGVGGPTPPDYVAPVYDYVSDGSFPFGGNSVVGGYVYRGPDPEVQGRYFFGDSFPSRLWTFDPADPDGTVANVSSLLNPSGGINLPVSFGEDAFGNLYIVNRGGQIYRIETDALLPGDFNADGQITVADYQKWREDFGMAESTADGNGDGVVDAADYTIWRDAFSDAANSTTPSTPEPSAVFLVVSLLLAVCPRRR